MDPTFPASDEPVAQRPTTRGRVIERGVATTGRWSLWLLLTAAGLTVVVLTLIQLWTIVFPIFLGLVIATVLEPGARWLRERGLAPALAALIVVVGALAAFVGVLAAVAPTVISQAPGLVSSAQGGIEQIQQWLAGPPFNLGESELAEYVTLATDQLQQSAGAIAGGVVVGLTAVGSGLLTAVLALVLAFLFVKDGRLFLPWLRRAVGEGAGVHLQAVGGRAWAKLGGFIRSQALIGLVDATFIGLGLVLLGVDLALPLAVLVFFGAFIPIVGALVTGALAVLVALVTQGFGVALAVLVLVVVVQQVEGNLLQPYVQGRGLGLNAAVVILAVTAGASLGGVAGAFVAVPLTAMAAEVIRYCGERIDAHTEEGDEPADPGAGADGPGTDEPSPEDSVAGGAEGPGVR